VQVFEHEDERVELCEPLEEPPPGGEALGAPVGAEFACVAETEERSEPRRDPLGVLRLGTASSTTACSLAAACSSGSPSRMPA
jgi:hypothetical protein